MPDAGDGRPYATGFAGCKRGNSNKGDVMCQWMIWGFLRMPNKSANGARAVGIVGLGRVICGVSEAVTKG